MKWRNYSAVSHSNRFFVVVVVFCEIFSMLCVEDTLPKTTPISHILSVCFPSKPHLLISSPRVEEFYFRQQLAIVLLTNCCYTIWFSKVSFNFGKPLVNISAFMAELGIVCHFSRSWNAKEDTFVQEKVLDPGPFQKLWVQVHAFLFTSCVTLTETSTLWELSPHL